MARVIEAKVIGSPRFKGRLRVSPCRTSFGLGELDIKGRDDVVHDLLAQGVNVIDASCKKLAPDDAAIIIVEQFSVYRKSVSDDFDRPA